jgi:hypothetical protein
MKKIKFELNETADISFVESQHVELETSLNGESIEDYLLAFKAFLIACSWTEDSVKTIDTYENFLSSEAYQIQFDKEQ